MKDGLFFFFFACYLWNILNVFEDEWLISSVYVYVNLIFWFCSVKMAPFLSSFFVWLKIKDVPNGTRYLTVNTCFFYFSDKNTFTCTRPTIKCEIFLIVRIFLLIDALHQIYLDLDSWILDLEHFHMEGKKYYPQNTPI